MIYFSDNFNFRRDNFSALYEILETKCLAFSYDQHNTELKKSFGLYSKSYFHDQVDEFILKEELYRGIRLYNVYELEVMHACSCTNTWKDSIVPVDEVARISFLYYNFYYILQTCRNAAKEWIDYWFEVVNSQKIDIGINFGGSLIYANAFARVLSLYSINTYSLEHFFTGNDFYFENRIEHLPNNSILKNSNYCENIIKSCIDQKQKYIKLNAAKNKNVKPIPYSSFVSKPYCLILGQVCNDFSILSKANSFKNAPGFYLDLICLLLKNTDLRIVVKTHPYEKKKLRQDSITTFDFLKDKLNAMHITPDRVCLVEDFSLNGLIDGARFVITLNSQSGIEALARFKPLVCFGGAFYGGKGFTYDFTGMDEFSKNILNIKFDIEKYNKFLHFLDAAFLHLVNIKESSKIEPILCHSELSQIVFRKLPQKPAKAPTQEPQNKSSSFKKLRKLFRDPEAYFRDMKIFHK